MKKTLSLILAVLMTLSCASFVFADAAIADEGRDINVEAYQDSIAFLDAYDIYNGDMTETDATNEVLRWHMALFVARITTGLLNDKDWKGGPEDYSEFTDIDGVVAESYLGAISYASQMGIINGYGDGTFGPYDGIQYQQAVKMLCCALGYTGLEYPWGYMQKATNIGLDAVIKDQDVAPTTELCRAEVGQLIYNALFVETAKGDTLATRIFGVDFGWENVVITATDKAHALADGVNTTKDSKLVGFQILLEDGTLDSNVILAYESDLGLGDNTAELALGKVYKVLFEIEDNGATTVKYYKALETKTIEDRGATKKGNIKAALDAVALVSKYNADIYYTGKDQVIVQEFSANAEYVKIETVENGNWGIDWDNGNIVKKNADGEWVVEWYYNTLIGKYFKITEGPVVDDYVEGSEIVGIKYMTAAEAENLKALFAGTLEEVVAGTAAGLAPVLASDKLAAFADLETVDVDGDGVWDRGIYRDYELGQITKSDEKYTFKKFAALGLTGNGATADNPIVTNVSGETFNSGAYALYDYNKSTNELKIIDVVDEVVYGNLTAFNMAGDGSVTITTYDGELITMNTKYEGLDTMFSNASKATAQAISTYFTENFNQWVKVLVFEGKAVAIEVQDDVNYIVVDKYAGLSDDGYITVYGYNTANPVYDLIKINSYNGWATGDYYYHLSNAKVQQSFTRGTVYEIASVQPGVIGDDVYNVNLVGAWGSKIDSSKLSDIKIYGSSATEGSTATVPYTAKEGYIKVNGNIVKADSLKPIIFINGDYAPVKVFDDVVVNDTWKLEAKYITEIESAYVVILNTTNTSGVGFGLDNANASLGLYEGITSAMDWENTVGKDWYLMGAVEYTVTLRDLFTGKTYESKANYNLGKLVVGNVYYTYDNVVADKPAINTVDTVITTMKAMYADNSAYLGDASADYLFYGAAPTTDANGYYVSGGIKYNATDFADAAAIAKYISTELVSNSHQYVGKYETFLSKDNVTVATITADANGAITVETVKDNKYANHVATADNEFVFIVYDVEAKSAVVYIVDAWACATKPADPPPVLSATFTTAPIVIKTIDVASTGATNDVINIMATVDYGWKKANETAATVWYIDSIHYYFEDDATSSTNWIALAKAGNAVAAAKLAAEGIHFGEVEAQVGYDVVIDGTELVYDKLINKVAGEGEVTTFSTAGKNYVLDLEYVYAEDYVYDGSADVNMSLVFGNLDDNKAIPTATPIKSAFEAYVTFVCASGSITTNATNNNFYVFN